MRLVAYLVMIVFCTVTLLQPMVHSSLSLKELYHQCSLEDPDITPIDFVFEHLLNFEVAINFIEGNHTEEHKPYKWIQSQSQVFITIPNPIHYICSQQTCFANSVEYNAFYNGFCRTNYFTDILRPPIV